MPRRQRIHVPEGNYYVVQRGCPQQPVFSQPDDYALFEQLLPAALRRTGARVHAYCWTAQAIHLAVQIDEISVGRFMQGLTSRYARGVQRRTGDSGHFFRHRYHSVLIDPRAYLPKLIRYIHHVPVLTGHASTPEAYQHTSHHMYLGNAHVPWVHTHTALRMLDSCDDSRLPYRQLMSEAPPAQEVHLFERGGRNALGIVGGPEFMANLPRHARPYRTRISIEQIIENVTRTLDVRREHVLSNSRQRKLALARALIAWFATERHAATLSEVARYLRRDPSTLSVAISRYRECRPELFQLTAFRHLVPLGPVDHHAHRESPASDIAVGMTG